MNLQKNVKHTIIKVYEHLFEKTFQADSGDILHYIYRKGKSNRLIVVFSGFAGYSVKGRYNYLTSLMNIRDNVLFIKDDLGYYSVGTYYFGEKCTWLVSNIVCELIELIRRKSNSNQIITCGSSKGGSAALYYGLKVNAEAIICGSPQYKIAHYLTKKRDNESTYWKDIFSYIEGNEYGLEEIDNILNDCIRQYRGHTKVILLYSSKEASWGEDVHQLYSDLKDAGLLDLDYSKDLEYTVHDEIGTYMKKLLVSIISGI